MFLSKTGLVLEKSRLQSIISFAGTGNFVNNHFVLHGTGQLDEQKRLRFWSGRNGFKARVSQIGIAALQQHCRRLATAATFLQKNLGCRAQ